MVGKLPLWHRDALRRLTTRAVGQPDIEALTSTCLADANQRAFTQVPVPLDFAHVPAVGGSATGSADSLISRRRPWARAFSARRRAMVSSQVGNGARRRS